MQERRSRALLASSDQPLDLGVICRSVRRRPGMNPSLVLSRCPQFRTAIGIELLHCVGANKLIEGPFVFQCTLAGQGYKSAKSRRMIQCGHRISFTKQPEVQLVVEVAGVCRDEVPKVLRLAVRVCISFSTRAQCNRLGTLASFTERVLV